MSPRRRTPANRPIRDDTARLDPATTRLPAVEPRTDPFPVVRLDVPDERTPLYDALYAIHGLGGRHALNPHREVPMGKHHDEDGDGVADQQVQHRQFEHDDGSVYERIPAAEIDDDGDLIDSTTVEDPGAPA